MSLLQVLGKRLDFSLSFMMYIPLCVLTDTIKQIASVCNVAIVDLASSFLRMQKTCCPGIETLP